eukprot:scaffold3554_cov84-Cyclotella_meneghiniana.AAC.1
MLLPRLGSKDATSSVSLALYVINVLGWGTDGCSAVGSHGLGIRCMDRCELFPHTGKFSQ